MSLDSSSKRARALSYSLGFLPPRFRLLCSCNGQKFRVPPLADIRMALHAVIQRGLAQVVPPALLERELNLAGDSRAIAPFAQHRVAHVAHLARHVDTLKCGIVADALEEGHAEPWTFAGGGAKHAVCCALRYAVREGFETLADGYDKGAWDGRAVNPVSCEVLRLQAAVVTCLEEI